MAKRTIDFSFLFLFVFVFVFLRSIQPRQARKERCSLQDGNTKQRKKQNKNKSRQGCLGARIRVLCLIDSHAGLTDCLPFHCKGLVPHYMTLPAYQPSLTLPASLDASSSSPAYVAGQSQNGTKFIPPCTPCRSPLSSAARHAQGQLSMATATTIIHTYTWPPPH